MSSGTLSSQHRNAQAERSVIDLARTRTNPDERAVFSSMARAAVSIA